MKKNKNFKYLGVLISARGSIEAIGRLLNKKLHLSIKSHFDYAAHLMSNFKEVVRK